MNFIENPAKTTMIHILDQMETDDESIQPETITNTTGLDLFYFNSHVTSFSRWKGLFQNCTDVRSGVSQPLNSILWILNTLNPVKASYKQDLNPQTIPDPQTFKIPDPDMVRRSVNGLDEEFSDIEKINDLERSLRSRLEFKLRQVSF